MHSNKTKNKSKNETRLKALIVATLLILSSFVYFAISSTTFAASSDTLIEFRIDPPACVHNNPTILVSPTNRRVNPGGSTTYSVAVINNDSIGCGVATFNLSFTNLAGFPFSPATGSVTLAPGAASATQVITVTTPSYSALGVYSLSFRVTNSAFSTFTHLQTVTLTVVAPTPPEPPEPPEPPAPVCVRNNPTIIVVPASVRIRPGESISYSIVVRNNDSEGCDEATFDITYTSRFGFTFSPPTKTVTLSSGESSPSQTVIVTAPDSLEDGVYELSFKASNSDVSSETHTQTVSLTVGDPTPPPPPDTGDKEPPLKNLPDFLQNFGRFLVDIVPEPIREFFRGLPAEIVNQLPLYIFILALIFILIPIPQSIREYLYKRRLMAFYKREQSIAEEKDNFLNLASHYTRTPIAIMKDSIPLMLESGDIVQSDVGRLNHALETLSSQVSAGLNTAESNAAQNAAATITPIKPKPFWRSGFFWIPIILSIILTLLVNFLIGVVGDREIGVTNALFQFFIIVAFIVVLYLIVRNYHIQKKLRQENDALINRERTIDATRNEFIEQQTANIGAALSDLHVPNASYPPSKPYNLYSGGLDGLKSVYSKFVVLPFIKTGGSRNATTFSLKAIIDRVVSGEQDRIADKKLTIQNSVPDSISITQNESLFSFVITSVLDNAIKFSNSGGKIEISSQPKTKTIQVKISDNGHGIDPAKINQLFKPFSRAESAIDFAYEGMGLSLFLDRLILTYTGGEISVNPRPGGGTEVSIITPTDVISVA